MAYARLLPIGLRELMSEPAYLFGDDYAYNGGYEELIDCNICNKMFDRVEYRSDTCSDCEDEIIKREKARA